MNVVTSRSEDLALVYGLKNGEKGSLEKIYQTFFSPVFGFIRSNSGNVEDAKDIFQEGIMVMYRMVQKEDFQLTSSFLSLLFSICRNLWFKSLRKRPFYEEVGESREAQEMELDKGIEEIINDRAIDSLVRKKLGTLGAKCRALLDLFFEGYSMKEIVSKLKMSSISFAKKKKFQCKERLVQMVKADPVYMELGN